MATPPQRIPLVKLKNLASLMALVWIMPGVAHASEAEIAEIVVTGAPQTYSQPFTVSAMKTATALIDTPQAVNIITQDQIKDQAMQGVADAVRYMPGVGMAQGEGHRNAPIMRGVTSTANLFVDGLRDDVEYFRDLYNVERIEALSGPNGMIFGRGGGGGVINRVSRQADGIRGAELTLTGGSWKQQRVTTDLKSDLTPTLSARLTGLYETADSYRDGVVSERSGLNPSLLVKLTPSTTLRADFEHFTYEMVTDRGIPSFAGRALKTSASTFFGSPRQSPTELSLNVGTVTLDHDGERLHLRSTTRFGDYDKTYQNLYPGAVSLDGAKVALSAYANATQRQSLLHQTDVTGQKMIGGMSHKLLAGIELGQQITDNRRTTGYFSDLGPTVTSLMVPVTRPTLDPNLNFRPSSSDADNHGTARSAGLYLQDQISLNDRWIAVLGLRHDLFTMRLRNNRTGQVLSTEDRLWSPRAGLIYKPQPNLSVYGSYSQSYLPRAGDQLASLTLANSTLAPEAFRNQEVGIKWDLRPNLALTLATYRLERTHVAVVNPTDPTQMMLVDGQTSSGLELGINGAVRPGWTIAGGYAYQEGEITQTQSSTAKAGARLAQLPKQSLSLWNRVDVTPRLGLGLGIVHRSAQFTSTDNSVTLPGYSRVDGAIYWRTSPRLKAQLNVENLFDIRYLVSAHNNNNITPGSPRAVKLTLSAGL
jgi:catecholate siderophore receptor